MPAPNTATNRTFFSNFLAAFRAHSALQTAASTASTNPSTQMTYTHASTAPSSTLATNPPSSGRSTPHPRASNSTSKPGSQHQQQASPAVAVQTTTTTTSFQPKRHHSTSPMSRSPGPAAASTPTNSFPIGSPPLSAGRTGRRRGSNSSSESGGFRDALGGEKWYVGGRTAAGEERFFQVGLVRRPRSVDRLSMDRLSL